MAGALPQATETVVDDLAGAVIAGLAPRRVLVAGPGSESLAAAFQARGIDSATAETLEDLPAAPHRHDVIAWLGMLDARAIAALADATDSALVILPVAGKGSQDGLALMETFAAAGLWPDLAFDATALHPRALLLRRGDVPDAQTQQAMGETLRRRQGLGDAPAALPLDVEATARLVERLHDACHVLGDTLAAVQAQIAEAKRIRTEQAAALHILQSSQTPTARASAAVRTMVDGLPAPVGRLALAGARLGWWAATPHRMPARLRRLRETGQSPVDALKSLVLGRAPPVAAGLDVLPRADPPEEMRAPLSTADILAEDLASLRQLPIYAIDHGLRPRLTLVTDSIAADSFFGGVGTATILAALWARRRGAALRIVTLRAEPVRDNVAALLRGLGVVPPNHVEFHAVGLLDGSKPVDVSAEDVFVTTSWWSTVNTLRSVPTERVAYIVQEDERMFYPLGDDWLRAQEAMGTPGLRRIVNTRLLHDHLATTGIGGLDTHARWFEPAFPDAAYYPDRSARPRLNFFFYARPGNPRNLYLRGLEAIGAAIAQGVLDPAAWQFHFVGRDLPRLVLPGDVPVTIVEGLPWDQYVTMMRRMDLGLSLMLTPHPSYPPLDLVACGAVAVTNSFGAKRSLAAYSENLICAEPSVDALVEALREGAALARDGQRRAANHARQGLQRSWNAAFAGTLDWLEGA